MHTYVCMYIYIYIYYISLYLSLYIYIYIYTYISLSPRIFTGTCGGNLRCTVRLFEFRRAASFLSGSRSLNDPYFPLFAGYAADT